MSSAGADRKISPGEYCTMVRAEELGILSKEQYKANDTKAPFNSTLYKDVKTFNSTIDSQDRRTKSLCKETIDKKEAYPHCSELYGPGYSKLGTPDENQPYKCEVYDCPPGFTRQGQYCNKEPLFNDARIDKRSRCDERWYDWFLIPNYHLGNKFHEQEVGKCFAPCPVRHVPAFASDPVDSSRGDISSDDKLDQCVPRDMYFAGKYAEGTDYCPLSWIMRIYASNPQNAKELIHAKRKKIEEIYGNANDLKKTDRLTQQFKNVARIDGDDIAKEAEYLATQLGNYLDNVDPPKGPMQQACSTLNSKENLQMAYNVCKLLQDQQSLPISSDPARNVKQNIVLRQACNAVFCNENEDSLDIIGKEPLCFQKTPKLSEDALGSDESDPPAPTFDKEDKFFRKSFRTFLIVLFVPILFTMGYFAWTRFLWPKLVRPPILLIIRLLTGRRFLAMQYREARMAEIEHLRGAMLRK